MPPVVRSGRSIDWHAPCRGLAAATAPSGVGSGGCERSSDVRRRRCGRARFAGGGLAVGLVERPSGSEIGPCWRQYCSCMASARVTDRRRLVAIRAMALFDGVFSTLMPDPVLVMDGRSIVSVESAIAPPSGAEVVDL